MFFSSSSWGNCSWTSEKKNHHPKWIIELSPLSVGQQLFTFSNQPTWISVAAANPPSDQPLNILFFFSSRWHFGGSCRGFTADEWNRGPTDTARLGSFGTWASWPSQNKWLMGSLVAAPTRWAPNQSKKWSYGFGATLRSQKKSRELEDEEMSPLWGFFKALFSVSGV